jgi:hypothetical protein
VSPVPRDCRPGRLEREPVEVYAEVRPNGRWTWRVAVVVVDLMPIRGTAHPDGPAWGPGPARTVEEVVVWGKRERADARARYLAERERDRRRRLAVESHRVDP